MISASSAGARRGSRWSAPEMMTRRQPGIRAAIVSEASATIRYSRSPLTMIAGRRSPASLSYTGGSGRSNSPMEKNAATALHT
jgi:hypothetical protein